MGVKFQTEELELPIADNQGGQDLQSRAARLRGTDIFNNQLLSDIDGIADITRSHASDKDMLTTSERKNLFARLAGLNSRID